MNKKWVTIGVLVVLASGGGYWGYKHFTAKPVVASNITAKAKLGDVSKVITATGTVNFPQAIPLTFQQAGMIVQLNVKAGDSVKAGQVLAKTDDTKLSTAVLQAQANVTSAQAKLQTLQDGFNAQTQAQAQAALASAQQAVASGQQGLTTAQQNSDSSYLANQVSLANQTVKQASDDLAKAQQSGNTSSSQNGNASSVQSGNSSSIQSAQSTLNKALSDLAIAQNAQNGGAAQALASSEAQTRTAQANLTSAQYQVQEQAQGPKAGDLESAQSGIQLAQVQLTSAQTDLSNAAIIAPMDAIVVSAPFLLNQQSDAKSIITITPTGNNLEVDAAIDQSDIDQVKNGQKVDITLDSNPNQHISGTVSLVALQGTIVSNVTTYNVTVAVDQASDILRAGMNANVNIVVAEAKNVLTVPSGAIKTRGNQSGVTVPATSGTQPKNAGNAGTKNAGTGNAGTGSAGTGSAGTRNAGTRNAGTGNAVSNVQYIPVVIGLDDGTNVEIKSGLVEGQDVIIGTRSVTGATASSGFSLGGGGGGGNPARALSGGGNRGN